MYLECSVLYNSRRCSFKSRGETTAFDQHYFRGRLNTNDDCQQVLRTKHRRVFRRFSCPFASVWTMLSGEFGQAEFVGRRLEGYQHTLGDIWPSSFSRDSTHSRYGTFDPSNWYTIGIPGKPVQWSWSGNWWRNDKQGGGRIPTFLLLQDQVTQEGQGTKLGFRSVDIARMLGMSTRTLSRRRQELCMPLSHQHNISSLSD